MYQTYSFRATMSQKSFYLIGHYAISGFGWTYQYIGYPWGKTSTEGQIDDK